MRGMDLHAWNSHAGSRFDTRHIGEVLICISAGLSGGAHMGTEFRNTCMREDGKMTRYRELIEKANDIVNEFSAENCTCTIDESIHIQWVICDAEEMIKKLKAILPEVKELE